jgi:hypothetical protein
MGEFILAFDTGIDLPCKLKLELRRVCGGTELENGKLSPERDNPRHDRDRDCRVAGRPGSIGVSWHHCQPCGGR